LNEFRLDAVMTREEMAQGSGSSRETVTRLITDLKKRSLSATTVTHG
jgi:CRP-like cAMP-binding protein